MGSWFSTSPARPYTPIKKDPVSTLREIEDCAASVKSVNTHRTLHELGGRLECNSSLPAIVESISPPSQSEANSNAEHKSPSVSFVDVLRNPQFRITACHMGTMGCESVATTRLTSSCHQYVTNCHNVSAYPTKTQTMLGPGAWELVSDPAAAAVAAVAAAGASDTLLPDMADPITLRAALVAQGATVARRFAPALLPDPGDEVALNMPAGQAGFYFITNHSGRTCRVGNNDAIYHNLPHGAFGLFVANGLGNVASISTTLLPARSNDEDIQ